MAYIFIRGKSEALEINDKLARQAKGKWESCCLTKRHEPLEIGELTIMTSEIKAIQTDMPEQEDKEKKLFADYLDWRNEFKQLSPTERAEKSFQYFLFAYYVFTGKKEVDEKQKEYVLKITAEFFEKYPAWCFPSMKIYEPIFKKAGKNTVTEETSDKVFMAGERLLYLTEMNEINFKAECL